MIDFQEDAESDDDMPGLEEKSMPPKTYEDENVTDDESDLELDSEGVVEADDEPPQKASRPCSHTLLFIIIFRQVQDFRAILMRFVGSCP